MSFYNKCIGCGVELTDEKDSIGYSADHTKPYCRRCFRINNYNQNENCKNICEKINEVHDSLQIREKDYVFMFIDILDIKGSLIKKYINHKNILFIINKVDLLPRGFNKTLTMNKINNIISSEGFNVNKNIIFNSSLKKDFSKSVLNFMDKLDKTIKIYLIGNSNSGKSSFINSLLKKTNSTKYNLTTSNYLNTTIKLISIKIANHVIIDTPGFEYKSSILNAVSNDDLKYLNKEIKPHNYVVYRETFFQFGDYFNIIVNNNSEQDNNIGNVTFYFNYTLPFKRVSNKEKFKVNNKLKLFEFNNLDKNKKYNISIPSLGLISFKNLNFIKVYVLDFMEVLLNTEAVI